MQETLVRFLGWGVPLEKGQATYSVFLGFPGSLHGKESTCNLGDQGLISGLGRSPGRGRGDPPQYSCLENSLGQSSLAGCSPWGHKESDMIQRPRPAQRLQTWDKSCKVVTCSYFHLLLNWICCCFVEDFYVYIHERYRPVGLVSGDFSVWFYLQGNGCFTE